jgi:MFS family permease
MAIAIWKLKLTLLLVSGLTIMSVITISPALPGMATHFSSVERVDLIVKLVFTIPALMIAVFSPITGRLIDRHGRLKLLWFSLVLYALAGVSGYFLEDLFLILLSRAVLGIAVGISMTIVITLIADYFDGMERQKFVGLQVAFMSLGGIVFVGVGGVLADMGWRYPFLIYLFSLFVLPLAIIFLHEPAVTNIGDRNIEHAKAHPIIWLLFVNTMVMWILFFLIPVQIPFYLTAIGVTSATLTGVAIALSTAFSAVSAFSYSRIKARLSFLSIFSIGYFLMAVGYICLSFAHSYVMVILAMILAGLGVGMMIPNTNMWVMKIAPPAIRGKEIGKLTTFWFMGQFLSPIITYPILNVLTLPSTFMLSAGVTLVISASFLILHFSRRGRLVMQ